MKSFKEYINLIYSTCFVTMMLLIPVGVDMLGAGEPENLIPRPEHPKPQFERGDWLNLNGQWNFAFDFDLSGIEKGWPVGWASLWWGSIVLF